METTLTRKHFFLYERGVFIVEGFFCFFLVRSAIYKKKRNRREEKEKCNGKSGSLLLLALPC